MSIMGLLFLLVMVMVFAFTFKAGLWNNLTRLIVIITAGLIATNWFEPLASYIETSVPWLWYFADYGAIWTIFCVALFSLNYVTMKLSFTSVRFTKTVDEVGSAVFSAACGFALVCFVAMTLHMAPLGRESFFGSFKPEQPMFFGLYPDRMWLAFCQQCSRGVYSNGDANVFDPKSDFLLRTAAKRERFDAAKSAFSGK